MMVIYNILFIVLCICSFWGFHWWIKMRFIAEGFQVSGSYNKKKRLYLTKWNPLQRILLIPLFSTQSNRKYRVLAVLNYCHLFLAIFTIVVLVFQEYFSINILNLSYCMIAITIIAIAQMVRLVH